MSLFGARPGTLMFPTAVQADTSLGSVVIRTVSEPRTGPGVLTQASRINTSAKATLTEMRRVEVARMGLDVGIALPGSEIAAGVGWTGSIGLWDNCLGGGFCTRKAYAAGHSPASGYSRTQCHWRSSKRTPAP